MVKQNPSCTGIRDHVFSVRPFWRHLFRCRTFPAQIVSAPIRRSSTVHLIRVSKKHRKIVPKWLRRKVVDPCNTRQRIMVILTPRKEWASITTLVTTADGCSLVAFYVSLDLRLTFPSRIHLGFLKKAPSTGGKAFNEFIQNLNYFNQKRYTM